MIKIIEDKNITLSNLHNSETELQKSFLMFSKSS